MSSKRGLREPTRGVKNRFLTSASPPLNCRNAAKAAEIVGNLSLSSYSLLSIRKKHEVIEVIGHVLAME